MATYEGDYPNPLGFIRGLLNEGVGPTEGLRMWRGGDTPGQIQDSRWFELYNQTASTYADRAAQLSIDPFSIPGPENYETWELGRGNQYATQVEITVRARDTGEYLTKQYTYLSAMPHSAAEAEANAIADFGDPEAENEYGETLYGALAVTFAQTVPYAA